MVECVICITEVLQGFDTHPGPIATLQSTFSKLITYFVLRSAQPPILSGIVNEYLSMGGNAL